MAGRTVTREDIQAAAKAYCEATGLQCSIGEDDHKIRFFNGTPGDGDQVVWEEAGQLRANNSEFGLEFREYLPEPVKSPNSANLPARQGNVPPARRNGQDGAHTDFDMDSWRKKQARSYSVAGKNAPNAFSVSEEANKRGLSTQIMDSGRTKELVWGHVRVTDPATGQYREDRVSHEKETFVILKAWEDANSQAKFQKGLIIGIADNSMPELNPEIRIKGMPAQLWLTMQVMRSWSFADRDAITKAERRAQLKMLNREWREDDEIVLEQEEERAVQEARA
jgi:hypothetical protein